MAVARKSKNRKAKKKRRRKAPLEPTRCNALMVVDSSRIRRKSMADCKRARTTFEKAERELDVYESRDKPAFTRWYHSVTGSQLTDIKSLSSRMQDLYAKMQRLAQFAELAGCRRHEAAQLYENSPQEFERREREHAERVRRAEERWQRDLEEQRAAAGRAARASFASFLNSRPEWLRKQLRSGASAEELFFELLLVFCDEEGYFPSGVMMALEHPEGVELLEQYGLPLPFDLDDGDFFDPDGDPFGPEIEEMDDDSRESADTHSKTARLKSLRRELAFALHPDQSDSDSDPAKLELWHQVQEAVEARDLDRLEVLHAHLQMLSGELSPQAPVARVLDLTRMYRRSRAALRRRIRALRKAPDWGFSMLDEGRRETMRRQLKKGLHTQIERLREDLAEARETYRQEFTAPPDRKKQAAPPDQKQQTGPPVREPRDHPGQARFDFL